MDSTDMWGIIIAAMLLFSLIIQVADSHYRQTQYQQILGNQQALFLAVTGSPVDLTHDFGTAPVKEKK